jgi:uncharacterized protein YgiM (DUF1202 family)
MKTTRLLIPVMALAASTLLMAQVTPGQPPKRKPAPAPAEPAPPPTPIPAEPEAFPAPGDPAPTPATPAPVPTVPAAPGLTPIVPIPPPTTTVPIVPIVPAGVENSLNIPQGEPFIGFGIINGTRVSARGKATLFSALVFQFNKNEPVNIVEEINITNPKAGEPRKWLRVQVPGDAGVWVHADFLNAPFKKNGQDANGQPVVFTYAKVKANLLNVRGGAGEHFPILGKLPAGATVQVSGRRNEKWVELYAPANATVFVAAHLVTRKPGNQGAVEVPFDGVVEIPSIPPTANPPVAPITPTVPAETIVTIPAEAFGQPNGLSQEGVPIKRAATPPTPAIPPPPTPQPAETAKPSEPLTIPKPVEPTKVAEANPNLPPASTEKPGTNEPPIRIVTREGYVRRTLEIQAPSGYVLEHVESGKKINYLLLDHPTLKLNWFIGQRVLVSGQEAIDVRHANTPVLKVKTLKGEVSKEALTRIAVTQSKEPEQAAEEEAEPESDEPKSDEPEKSDDK